MKVFVGIGSCDFKGVVECYVRQIRPDFSLTEADEDADIIILDFSEMDSAAFSPKENKLYGIFRLQAEKMAYPPRFLDARVCIFDQVNSAWLAFEDMLRNAEKIKEMANLSPRERLNGIKALRGACS